MDEATSIAKAIQCSLIDTKKKAKIEKALLKNKKEEETTRFIIFFCQTSEEIPNEVIVESLKTLTKEQELK